MNAVVDVIERGAWRAVSLSKWALRPSWTAS